MYISLDLLGIIGLLGGCLVSSRISTPLLYVGPGTLNSLLLVELEISGGRYPGAEVDGTGGR